MKKSPFFILVVLLQVFLVFFYIHHHSLVIKQSFQRQKYEKKKIELNKKIEQIKQELHRSHDLATIKEFALKTNMQKTRLDQVKTAPA